MPQPSNPFCAERIRPGAIPFRFSATDVSTDSDRMLGLLQRWETAGWVGQIVGPHGVGKTTLAHSMLSAAINSERWDIDNGRSVVFRAGGASAQMAPQSGPQKFWRWLLRNVSIGRPPDVRATSIGHARDCSVETDSPHSGLVLDGVEQLPWTVRQMLLSTCRRKQVPILLTAHRPLRNVPVLLRLTPDAAVFKSLAMDLARNHYALTEAEIATAFTAANANCREALLRLYDACEEKSQLTQVP